MKMEWNPKGAIGLLIVLCVVWASGCSSHTVRYNVNSDKTLQGEDQQTGLSSGDDAQARTSMLDSRTFPYSGEAIDPGALSQTHRPAWNDAPFVVHPSQDDQGTLPYAGIRYFEPNTGFSEEGANYGPDYGGVEGFGATNGPVTGFGSGRSAESINPDPETWARAYLGKEGAGTSPPTQSTFPLTQSGSRQDDTWGGADYGHDYPGVPGQGPGHGPVTGFGSGAADPMYPDPEAWARGYLRDDNAETSLPLEHVEEGMVIAKANPTYPPDMSGGHLRENPRLPGVPQPTVQSQDLDFIQPTSTGFGKIEDVYFDFDSWKITETGRQILEADAEWLKANPEQTVTIEGHCDPRGTQSYNLVLGKKRAEAAKAYLIDLGVAPERIKVISYGEERPFCTSATETCYRQNRRGHFVVMR